MSLINKSIGNLTILKLDKISNYKKYYLCQCICGKLKSIRYDHLIANKIKSCGCLKQKYNPKETSAKAAWRSTYKDCDFNVFIKYSQMDCHYCKSKPLNKLNCHIYYANNNSTDAKINGEFIYNGLDRVNNNLGHTIDNIIPCCRYCNSAKLNKSYEDFINWIYKVKFNNNSKNIENKSDIVFNKYQLSAAKGVWQRLYKDISFNNFLKISQLKCFYCGEEKSNTAINYYKNRLNNNLYTYKYNGLDRLNNDGTHSIENIVPCCNICNKAKLDRNADEFYIWVDQLYANLDNLKSKSIKEVINYYKSQI